MAPGGVEPPRTDSKSVALSAELRGPAQRVADGTRTHDHLDHNQGLYQLSYRHRGTLRIAASRPGGPSFRRPIRRAHRMRLAGFEPATRGLEGRRSVH